MPSAEGDDEPDDERGQRRQHKQREIFFERLFHGGCGPFLSFGSVCLLIKWGSTKLRHFAAVFAYAAAFSAASLAQPSTKAVTTPFQSPGAGGIRGQGRANAVLPFLGGHGGEVPGHAGSCPRRSSRASCFTKTFGGLLGALERDDKAHVVGHGLGALLRGDAPVDEVQGGLDVVLGGFAC